MTPASFGTELELAVARLFDGEKKRATPLQPPRDAGKGRRQIAKIDERVRGKNQIVQCAAGEQIRFDVCDNEFALKPAPPRALDH